MIKTLTIKRETENEEVKVFFDKVGDYWEVKTEPYNIIIEDSVGEMLEDIGMWDPNYLKEMIGDTASFAAGSF